MATLLGPGARPALWLQQQRLDVLDAAMLECKIEAVPGAAVRCELWLDLRAVNALLPDLAPPDGQVPFPISVWQYFGAGRTLGLSDNAGLPSASFAGRVTACGCDFAADRAPRLRVLCKGSGRNAAPGPADDGTDGAVLRVGQNLLALSVVSTATRSRSELTLQAQAHAQAEGWIQGADLGAWVRLQGIDALADGRYQVLSAVRQFDLSQGFRCSLRLQRKTS